MARRRDDVALAAIPFAIVAFCARYASAVGTTPHSTFSYKEGDPTGPAKWATLQKDWAICDSGTEQSPIDVAKVEVSKDLGPVQQTYEAGAAVMHNRLHDFMLNWTGGNGDLIIEGNKYTLKQPGEDAHHTIQVQASTQRCTWSTRTPPTPSRKPSSRCCSAPKQLKPYFERLAGKQNGTEEVKGTVDPAAWIDKASGYYGYEGSLTTPPCTEGVLWTIMSKVADASKEEIDSIESVKEANARPAQKINSRVVRYYKAGATEAPAPAPEAT